MITNPVPIFDFTVFLMDADPIRPDADVPVGIGATAGGGSKTIITGSFSEVSGLNAELETEEYREGGRNSGPHKFVKWGKFPNLVFKRGMTSNTALWDWYFQVLYGEKEMLRKHGLIVLSDRGAGPPARAGAGLPPIDRQPAAMWSFRNGLPEKLQGPGLNAKNNEIAIETLEIAHEGLIRLGSGAVPGGSDAASVSPVSAGR